MSIFFPISDNLYNIPPNAYSFHFLKVNYFNDFLWTRTRDPKELRFVVPLQKKIHNEIYKNLPYVYEDTDSSPLLLSDFH